MASIKPLSKVSEKWKRVAQVSQAEYEDGVKNPRTDWATATKAAEGAYKKGVTEAAAAGRFGKGVDKAGTSKWQTNAINKGPSRWSNGISLSTSNYEDGFKPYHDTIASLNLPPRGPKGDPANIARVSAVAKALHDKKIALKG